MSTVPAYPVAPGRCPHCGAPARQWPPARVLRALREWASRFGHVPLSASWHRATRAHPCYRTVQELFGSWSAGVRAAGLDPVPSGGGSAWTKDSIAEAMREWAREHAGEPPKASDWSHAGRGHPSQTTVIRQFGSWNAAVVGAGFAPRGPYGHLRLPASDARVPVPADVISKAIRDDGRSHEMIAELARVNERTVAALARGERGTLFFQTADRILCALGRPELVTELEPA